MKYIAAYLSGILTILAINCGNGPKLKIYISDPARLGMEFYDENTGQSGFVNYGQTDKFVCLNQTDMSTMMNFCGIKN